MKAGQLLGCGGMSVCVIVISGGIASGGAADLNPMWMLGFLLFFGFYLAARFWAWWKHG